MPARPSAVARVLIACGQGVYWDGRLFSEFADTQVYLEHARSVPRVVAEDGYTHVVCSGGYTRPECPDTSEAESFVRIWQDVGLQPPARVILDDVALDSAENLLLGLLAARTALSTTPIDLLGVSSAWAFKETRFRLYAETLGLGSLLRFHGLADADRSVAGIDAAEGEARQVAALTRAGDPLQLGPEWERKRARRYQRREVAFGHRLDGLRRSYPHVLDSVGALRLGAAGAIDRLRDAYQRVTAGAR